MDIALSDLRPEIKRQVKRKRQQLQAKCRKVWRSPNRRGEVFLFGWFTRNRCGFVVTLAHEVAGVMVPL